MIMLKYILVAFFTLHGHADPDWTKSTAFPDKTTCIVAQHRIVDRIKRVNPTWRIETACVNEKDYKSGHYDPDDMNVYKR